MLMDRVGFLPVIGLSGLIDNAELIGQTQEFSPGFRTFRGGKGGTRRRQDELGSSDGAIRALLVYNGGWTWQA
jgi:hypothetical protein